MSHRNTIASLFEGAAAKYLRAVDAEPQRSNQHEIGGLPSVGFKRFLGEPGKGHDSATVYGCTMAYLDDESDEPVICEDTVSWYDTRRLNPTRSPEYRLYYRSNIVTEKLRENDFFLIAKRRSGGLLLVFCPGQSAAELQLSRVFDVHPQGSLFSAASLPDSDLLLPVRMLLGELGIDSATDAPEDDALLELMRDQFGDRLPATRAFSEFAAELCSVNDTENADTQLVSWLEMEDRLFRIYERQMVATRIRDGFGQYGDDVDAFIEYSLSVQNRRKSRAGHALENHLNRLFRMRGLQFERGGPNRTTENAAKPDFIFPHFGAYHDLFFPTSKLRLLGAKTSCKDRWRQVLAEGDRIKEKHLITLQGGISEQQTEEMKAKGLQLIVPEGYQAGYSSKQLGWLMTLEGFVEDVAKMQV